MTKLTDKVKETISRYDMINDNESVLVGLSGGADSVCLLMCLLELKINISAFHVNHNLRGEESLRDKRFCVSLCEKLGVKIYTADIDVTGYCEKNHLSIEEGARELRYRELMSIGADKIATAHNINDCLETTVFNLARGTGLKGLCSIPPKRDNIIRPLIECTRQEIEQFLSERGQGFVTDSTNLEDEYTRNKIRHRVIPVLNDINSSLYLSYSATRAHLYEDNEYLESKAHELVKRSRLENGYDADILSKEHNAVLSRAAGMILQDNNIESSALRIDMTIETIRKGGKINICMDTYLVCMDGRLSVIREHKKEQHISQKIETVPCKIDFFEKKVSLGVEKGFTYSKGIYKKYKGNIVDADKLSGTLLLRNRRDGDRIALAGRGFTSKLKTLFNEKIPREERERMAILCDDNGIFYVEGFGIDERVRVDENTKSIMIIAIS